MDEKKERKIPVTFLLETSILDQLEELAKIQKKSRNALLNQIIKRSLYYEDK